MVSAVFVVYLLFVALAFLAIILAPVSQNEKDFSQMLNGRRLQGHFIICSFMVAFYYLSVNQLYHLMQVKARAVSYVKSIVVFILVFVIYYLVTNKFFSVPKIANDQLPLSLRWISYGMATTTYIVISILIAYFTFLRDEKKHQSVLEKQKQLLEVEKSTANFNFLKAQINPHFLHNTLSFLYAKSLPYSAELSEGILTLSKIMRYAIEEVQVFGEKVPLEKEVEHVMNVIKINQMRFSNKLEVHFAVVGSLDNTHIIPFVLITLVENAFKHGDLKDPNQPVNIKLKIEQGSLYFCCKNKKKESTKEVSTGIGLKNIRSRLDATYGSDYSLTITDELLHYTIQLTIAQL